MESELGKKENLEQAKVKILNIPYFQALLFPRDTDIICKYEQAVKIKPELITKSFQSSKESDKQQPGVHTLRATAEWQQPGRAGTWGSEGTGED